MSNSDEIRWQQRFENFTKALTKLSNACDQDEYSELEQAGLIQMFEMTFELCWKTLKDLLYVEGFDEKTPNSVIRRSFEAGFVTEDDCEILLTALKQRNLLSHTYEEKLAQEAVNFIKQTCHPVLQATHATLQGKL